MNSFLRKLLRRWVPPKEGSKTRKETTQETGNGRENEKSQGDSRIVLTGKGQRIPGERFLGS